MTKKGQSAMEYLMTYGWAILIIAIIFAILFIYIRPAASPEMCTSKAQMFACEGLRIVDEKLYVKITNGYPKALTINGIACAQAGTSPSEATYQTVANKEVGSGGYIKDIWDSSSITCKGAKKGSMYNGVIYIKYKEIDAPAAVPEKIAEIIIATNPQ
ncbi:MAG: hypothetical protein N3D10_02850 [Candidatus Micrarchaeota archaeon]|nr:hypothetical protein [Candidatus Micrarchaeota archaeon]